MWLVGLVAAVGFALVSGAIFWSALVTGNDRDLLEDWQAQAFEVMLASGKVENASAKRSGLLREAVLIGDPDLAARAAAVPASAMADTLQRLVMTDIRQMGRVAALREEIAGQGNAIDGVAKLLNAGRRGDAAEILLREAELDRGSRIQGIVADIVSAERLTLAARNARAAEAGEASKRYIYAMGIIGLTVLIVAAIAISFNIALQGRMRIRGMEAKLAAEIQASEARMRIAHESTSAGTWEFDLETGCILWSDELFKLYGRKPSSGVPSADAWQELIHPEDKAACPWIMPDRIRRLPQFTTEFRVKTASGYRSISSKGSAYECPDGTVRVVGMDLDVTEQIENRDKLEYLYSLLSEEHVSVREDRERIFEMAANLMAVCSGSGKILSANPAWTESLGYSEAELIGLAATDLFEGNDAAGLVAQMKSRLWVGETVVDLLIPMRANDGSIRKISWTLVPEDRSGSNVGRHARVFAVGRDVSEQLEVDERLREAEAQMLQMQKIETIGQMTGGVAHDFNNLLTPIVGYLEMLESRHSDDKMSARMINHAQQAAERARILVNRLLSFARRQHLEVQVVDIVGLIEGMQDLLSRTTGAGIEIELAAEEGLRPVKIDPNQFELALLNLVVNARDAMPAGGQLMIEVRREDSSAAPGYASLAEGPYVVVTVSDTGTGMDAATLEKAVEPFYSTKERGKGTGLGLSMVHGMAAQTGGALILESEVGKGTRASVWLPKAAATEKAERRSASVVALRKSRQLKILLVDDEALVLMGTADMLKDLGHSVVEASSGAEALSILEGGEVFDLLMTDFNMPSMTGGQLIEKVKVMRPDLPALIVSGYSDLKDRVSVEGVERLQKPFTTAQLSLSVGNAMSGEMPRPSAAAHG